MAVSERPAPIRPGFRRFAIGAFVLLVPIALHTAWDHYEARRLARIVAQIRARNEPVSSVPHIGSALLKSPENAARYYEAAAALVDSNQLYGVAGLLHRVTYAPEAERQQVVQEIRAWLDRNGDAERFLARATEQPFEGYPPGTGYSYRTDRLFNLARLANFRTFERLESGDGERAAQSIVQQLRINRPLGSSSQTGLAIIGSYWTANVPLRDVSRLLEVAPSETALQQVQTAIREIDVDAALEQSMLAERAFFLGNVWNESRGWYARQRDVSNDTHVMRPLMTRRFIETIEIMTRLLEAARQPWPARLHVVVPDKPPGSRTPGGFPFLRIAEAQHTLGSSYRSRAGAIASALALGRSSDAAIAAERYRRATGKLPDSLAQLVPAYLPKIPIDPFSGRGIRYVRTADHAAVYSVGSDEKDDGGAKLDYPRWRSGGFQERGAPPDLGVRIPVTSVNRR